MLHVFLLIRGSVVNHLITTRLAEWPNIPPSCGLLLVCLSKLQLCDEEIHYGLAH